MRRAVRTAMLAVAVAVAVVLAATWYGRLLRCQAELAAWTQIRVAFIAKGSERAFLEEFRQRPEAAAILEAVGVMRTEAAVARYCDAPVWEWWR